MHSSVDLLWLISSSGLVFLMQAGFLCLEAGATRRKNSINVVIKNIADLGISVLIFWAIGYGVMFGSSHGGWFGGNDYWLALEQKTAWATVFFVFQAMFCSTAVTILSGAAAERISFKGYIAISGVISGLIYPLFGHWAWNGLVDGQLTGWLGRLGFIDFAGSTVVHSVGGWSALATIVFIGPRLGRFSQKRAHQRIAGSDLPLSFLGAMLLWFGWFGFNGGSALAFDASVPLIIAHTLLAGAAGLAAPILLALVRQRSLTVDASMNGALAGLVSITANCHAVSTAEAIVIGAIGSWVMLWVTTLLERWHIDDAVGAIPVHLGAGIWGTLAVALFADPAILGTGLSQTDQLKVQVAGIVACGLWSFTATLVVLVLINACFPLRVMPREEYVGLNATEHSAKSALQDFYTIISRHARTGNLGHFKGYRTSIDAFSEAGQVSRWYRQVVTTLEQAVEKTEAIFQTAGEGILSVSLDQLRIQTINPSTERIFGLEKSAMIGRDFARFVSCDRSTSSTKTLLKLASERQRPYQMIGRHAEGHIFPLEMTVTQTEVFKDSFYTVMVRDITIRKEAETELQQSEKREREKTAQLTTAIRQLKKTQAQLVHSEKMAGLGQLVAGMAHEINNPINFIHGNLSHAVSYVEDLLQLLMAYRQASKAFPSQVQAHIYKSTGIDELEMDYLLEDFPRLMTSMQSGTERIRDIIASLRNFARHDESDLKVVDIHTGLESTLLMLNHQFNQAPVPIQVTTHFGHLPQVQCYASSLNQVFLDILTNAVDALVRGGMVRPRIAIATKLTGATVTIIIANNGPRIPTEIQSKIFEPFFTTKPIGEGTGLGLAMAHQIIVEQHGGQLYTRTGESTQFVIEIPVQIDRS